MDNEEVLKMFVKGMLLCFAFPALVMVIWNWQFGGILKVNYWQIVWLRMMITLLFYKEGDK